MGGISNFHAKINFEKSKISSEKIKITKKKGPWSQEDKETLKKYHQQEEKIKKLESKLSNPNESLAEKTLDRLENYSKEIQTVLNVGDNNPEKYIGVLMDLKSNTTREMVRKAIEKAKSKPDKTEEIFNQLKVDLKIRQFQLDVKQKNTAQFEETKQSLQALSNQASSIKKSLADMKSYNTTSFLNKQIDALELNKITLPADFNDSNVEVKVEKLKSEIQDSMRKASKAWVYNPSDTLNNIISKVKDLSAFLDQITNVFTENHLDLTLTKEEVSQRLASKNNTLKDKRDELEKAIIDSLGINTEEIGRLEKEKMDLETEIKILEDLQKKYHGSVDQIYDNQLQKWKTGKYKLLMSSTASNLDSKLKPAQREVVEEFEWQKTSSEAIFDTRKHFSTLTTFKQSKSIDDLIQKTTTRASKADLNAETKSRLDARIEELKSIKAEMTGSTLLGYVGWEGNKPTEHEQNAKLSQIQVLVFRKQDGNLEYKFLKEVAAKDDLFEKNGTEKADFKTDYKKSQLLKHLSADAIQGGDGDGVGGGGNDDLYTQGLEALRAEIQAAQNS